MSDGVGFAPVKVRWLKTIEGVPVFSGIEKIKQGETAVLDPHEAARAIKKGWATAVTDGPPATKGRSKAKGE